MIFTTKNKEFAIFGKTITDVKEKWKEFKKELAKNNGKLFGENGALASLFSGKKSNNILTPETLKQFEEFKEKFNSSSLSAEALAEQMENVDQRIIDYAKTCKNGEMTTEGFKASIDTMSFSAKAGKVALQALAMAGNMLAMWGISVAIQTVVKWIDKFVHSAEYAEKAIKAATDSAKSFSDSIKDIQKETVDMEKSIDSIIDRYAKLSQGVNTFTNENISLPTEQYEEFLGLNKQLTELFPSLTRNYDENGNAILGLSGSVDSVTESIRSLVEQEKELARAQIRENLEKYFEGTDDADGAWKALEGRKQKLEETNEELTTLKNTYEGLINADSSTVVGQYHKNFAGKEQAKYIEYIKNNFGEDIAKSMEDAVSIHLGKGLNGQFADIVVDFSKLELSETQKEQIAWSYDTFYSELLAKQKTAMSEFESQNSEFSNNAMLWLEDLSFYKDSDKYTKTAIQNLVRNIDWSNYDFKELDYEGVKRILQDSVLTPFQIACEDLNAKKSLDNALKGLFTMDTSDMSVDEVKTVIDSYINTIATAIEENPTDLKIRLGFDDSDTQPLINNVKEKLQDDFDDKVGELTLEELHIAAEKVEVPEGTLLSWDELIAKVKEVQDSTFNDKYPISSFKEAWESLDTTENDSLKSLKDDLLSLAEAGQLTLEKFTNTTGSSDFLMMLGIEEDDISEIDGLIARINKLKSSADQLSSMKKGISSLSENLYSREQEPDTAIDADVLAGMDSVLKEQTAEWDRYVTVLGDASSSMDDVQKATDGLATAYVNGNNFLANLTESNKDYYISQLDAMGVANSAEVVEERLNAQREVSEYKAKAFSIATKDLSDSLASHKQRSVDSVNATYANSKAFAEQSGMTDLAKVSLADLIAKEQIFASTDLNVRGKVSELNKLAMAYFGVANAIQVSSAMGGDLRYWNNPGDYENAVNEAWNAFIRGQMQQYSVGVSSSTSRKASTANNTEGNGSSGTEKRQAEEREKEFNETYDWIERLLKKLQSAFSRWVSQAEDALTSGFIGKYYKKAASAAESQLTAYGDAYSRYMAQADAAGLDWMYASRVRNGTVDIEEIRAKGTEDEIKKYEELADKVKEYQGWCKKRPSAWERAEESYLIAGTP